MSEPYEVERAALCRTGARLAARGLAPGTSGNLSLRVAGGFLMTPTNASLGELDPRRLALLDERGEPLAGDAPTKERFLHVAVYAQRPQASAVVHLHSPYAVALACLQHADERDVLPPLTPYAVMRVGRLPLVPYFRPGDAALAAAVGACAREHHAVLLANHGPVIAGSSLEAAAAVAEELEETARLSFILTGHAVRSLDATQIAELRAAFPS